MINIKKIVVTFMTAVALVLCYTTATSYEMPNYPRLSNCYLSGDFTDREVNFIANWDLLVLYYRLDRDQIIRDRIKLVKERNPNVIILMYISSIETNVTENPPGPMEEACDLYDWWLRDFEGSYLYNPHFPWSMLINMTNTDAASGNHPEEKKANEFLAEDVMLNHILMFDHWDGIFYDSYCDNLGWMYRDLKDATRNSIPEYDFESNEGEPLFADLWSDGMTTLLENTIAFKPDVIVMGNGLHKGTVNELNGKFLEGFKKSNNKNIHSLSSNHKYNKEGSRQPRTSIVNACIEEVDPTSYQLMRFGLCATLMTDNFYSCDFGALHHGETIWFDEYSILPNGTVDARMATLTADITAEQTTISVGSTEGFQPSGVVEIAGEQIYYESKDESRLLNCYRGFPRRNKYDFSAPHPAGSTVIHHLIDYKGYLGEPLGGAFDAGNPVVKLDDLLTDAGWFPDEHDKIDINTRLWRRNFQNGAVLVNPTDAPVLVPGLGDKVYRKISGIQDPVHNDGGLVNDTLRVDSGDGYILMWVSETDTIPPVPPEGLEIGP
jgi:hypothetical protein